MDLTCAACGAENPADARFCSACGAPLQQTCPSCGAEQPASAAFCSSCGTALREGVRPVAEIEDERQERRVVTVLFADLAGSTALGEQIDPEDVRELQGELFELINTEVERFGGSTEKFAGDAVLAVFGVPQAHEDDPERAVRAALAVRDRFGAFTERVRGRHGAEVGLRIGVNTGDVVAGRDATTRGELVVSGDVVNVAARLEQHAEPGEVLVGDRTQAATARTIAYRRHADVDAKGKSTPVVAWVALHAATEQPASMPRGVAGLTSPLVGRDEELAVLRAVAARVEREGTPQLVTLFGQAGVGKSRLLSELVQGLTAGPGHVLIGRCLPYGEGITYWPLAEVAKTHAGVLDNDPAETALAKLRAAIESVVPAEHAGSALDAAAWTIGFSLPGTPVTDSDPRQALARLEEGWAHYVEALGREQIAVVAVEDVHWASSPLLDLIERLAERLTGTRVLLVCTARIELLEMRPTWGAGKQNATTLSLTPLAPEQAAQLVSSILGEVPEEVRDRVLAHSEGNPFFVEEMLNMLIERGVLERRNGGWASAEGLADVAIPDSVHGVIAARIDLLDATSRDALRRCSVVGRNFWPPAVGVDEQVIDSLKRTGLVSDYPASTMGGMREFLFKHALTRDVVYSTLTRTERRDLHRQVAEWVQDVARDRGVEAAELAAYHYGQTLAYGEDDPAVAWRAYEALLTASDAAFKRANFAGARALVERAMALNSGQEALFALVRSEYADGRWDAALATLDRIEAGLEPGDVAPLSDVLAWRSRISWLTGRWEEALSSARAAVAVLDGLPESPQLARALARLSQIEMLKHQIEAIGRAEEAISVARRVGDLFAEVNARINLMSAQANRGRSPDLDEELELVELAVEGGIYDEAYRALANLLWNAPGYLHIDEIERVMGQARERLPSVLPPMSIGPYVEVSKAATLLVPAGRWHEADEIIEGTGSVTAASTQLVWLGLVGGLAMRRGALETAEPLFEELEPTALASEEPQRIVPMASVVLPWLLVTERSDELRSLADQVLTMVAGQWMVPITAVPILRALAAGGEAELLQRTIDSMRPVLLEAETGRLQTSLIAGEGLLALLEQRADDAVERLTKAAERERALGFAYDAACLELDLARALEAQGDGDAAAQTRARAVSVLEPLGCVHPF